MNYLGFITMKYCAYMGETVAQYKAAVVHDIVIPGLRNKRARRCGKL